MATPINVASRLAAIERAQAAAEGREVLARSERRSDRRVVVGFAVTVLLAILGAVFWAGRQDAKLTALEQLVREVHQDVRELRASP